MSRIVHFEVSADDVDRATRFYGEAFGWESQEWDGPTPYRFMITGSSDKPGIDGAVVGRDGEPTPIVLTLEVDDLAATMAKIAKAGGTVLDAGHPIPGLGSLGVVRDTEGNVFSVLQRAAAGG